MIHRLSGIQVASILWVLLTGLTLVIRPPLPVDETRYLAVAWDMWLEGHYLVPHLNGEPYSHKPPLLFWLMTAGWHLFGVNEWWPRLVAPLFGLGALVLTARLAQVLWPDRPDAKDMAPLLLMACGFWALFTTLTMFDMFLAFFSVGAIISLVMAARTGRWRGFVGAGVMIGFGILAKGPAVLLHILPLALAAPWWRSGLQGAGGAADRSWGRWYMGVGASVLIGAAVGLAWAVPAGVAGGEAYRDAIFWGQSAGRVVNSFAHARPFWWYAAVMPGLLVPLLLWPAFWRSLCRLKEHMTDGGIRLCLVWVGTAFAVFSVVSGKQLHYLLPEFPAIALLVAKLLSNRDDEAASRSWLPVIAAAVAGAAIVVMPLLPLSGRTAQMAAEMVPGWGALLLAVGVVFLVRMPDSRAGVLKALASLTAAAVLAIHLAAEPILDRRYDLTPIARELKLHENAGRKIADFGKYHGQYHFLGRLEEPLAIIGLEADAEEKFLADHADGVVVAYYRSVPRQARPLKTFTFRNLTVVLWPARALIDHPGIGDRR